MESDSSQIMDQYEKRLLKYQSTLEDNERMIQSHQKQSQILTASCKNSAVNLEKLSEIVSKLTFPNEKEAIDSIE